MIDFQNEYCKELSDGDFIVVYEALSKGKDVELMIVGDEEMQKINLEHRGMDKTTDVLSFPVEFEFANFLGSIVISSDMADKAAKEFGHSLQDEARLLFIHGMLHLLGFDHEIDNGEMRAREQEIIELLKLPASLIARNS